MGEHSGLVGPVLPSPVQSLEGSQHFSCRLRVCQVDKVTHLWISFRDCANVLRAQTSRASGLIEPHKFQQSAASGDSLREGSFSVLTCNHSGISRLKPVHDDTPVA